ncbi:serine/threonine protein kinase [Clostridium drakei]|uniref:Serine/threonine protein kinase n=1 Tax=Clostridium drakei TaxID=332101 RepID=A0A2U8DW93_9CLOT|nr:serine/threonine protein kinase [Clostridium drakei]AWI06514.1 serine/threonine protein kinase [Clostridium drakei]
MNNSVDKKYLGVNLKECKFIGKGRQGSVYLLPDKKRIIKIYNKEKGCKGETEILLRVQNNPHFAKVYSYSNKAMIREYIPGICIKNYISKNGLSKKLAINLIKLVESFKADGFQKLDIRLAHIFVQPNEDVRVIDPRKVFERKLNYPLKIMKGLRELSVLSKFMEILKEEYPYLYKQWSKKHR